MGRRPATAIPRSRSRFPRIAGFPRSSSLSPRERRPSADMRRECSPVRRCRSSPRFHRTPTSTWSSRTSSSSSSRPIVATSRSCARRSHAAQRRHSDGPSWRASNLVSWARPGASSRLRRSARTFSASSAWVVLKLVRDRSTRPFLPALPPRCRFRRSRSSGAAKVGSRTSLGRAWRIGGGIPSTGCPHRVGHGALLARG